MIEFKYRTRRTPIGAVNAPYWGLSAETSSTSAIGILSSWMASAPRADPMTSAFLGGRIPPSQPSNRNTMRKSAPSVTTIPNRFTRNRIIAIMGLYSQGLTIG